MLEVFKEESYIFTCLSSLNSVSIGFIDGSEISQVRFSSKRTTLSQKCDSGEVKT